MEKEGERMMKELLMDVATTTAMAVFTVGFCFLCRNVQMVAGNWLDKMRDEAENENQEITARMFGMAKELLDGITYNAVAAMEQIKAKEIREQVKAGLEDRSALTILAKDVLYGVKGQLTPGVTKTLETYIADLDAYIADRIEAYLMGIKQPLPAQLIGTPAREALACGAGILTALPEGEEG